MGSKIVGLGMYAPPKELTNSDLEKMVDTSDAWITERTGIRSRHIAEPGAANSDLCLEAARRALDDAGVDPAELDIVVVGTLTPDMPFPSTACFLQAKLGVAGTPALDVRQRNLLRQHILDDLTIDDHGALLNAVQPKDADLRRIQNRRAHQRSKHATVGDGERAAAQVFQGERAVFGLFREAFDRHFDVRKGHPVSIAQHRNNQAVRRANCHADVIVMFDHQVVALQFGVDPRKLPQRTNCRFHKKRTDSKRTKQCNKEPQMFLGPLNYQTDRINN